MISVGTLLTTILDGSDVFAYFNISEVEYFRYLKTHPSLHDTMNGTEVDLVLADGSAYPFKGKIETTESQFEEGAGAIAIRTRFDNS